MEINKFKYEWSIDFMKHKSSEPKYLDLENCKYLKKTTNKGVVYNAGDDNPKYISKRKKDIKFGVSLYNEIETIYARGFNCKETRDRSIEEKIAIDIVLNHISKNGGLIPGVEFAKMGEYSECKTFKLMPILISWASKIICDNGGVVNNVVEDMLREVFSGVCYMSEFEGGKGTGPGEIFTQMIYIGAKKPKKGDICIDGLLYEFKSYQARITAENVMMPCGYKGSDEKIYSEFKDDDRYNKGFKIDKKIIKKNGKNVEVEVPYDYTNNIMELNHCNIVIKRRYFECIISTYGKKTDKDVDKRERYNISQKVFNDMKNHIFVDVDNMIIRSQRAFDDFLQALGMIMYYKQSSFEALVMIDHTNKDLPMLYIPGVIFKLADTNRLVEILSKYVKYDNGYSDSGRYRQKQCTPVLYI